MKRNKKKIVLSLSVVKKATYVIYRSNVVSQGKYGLN